MKRLVVDPSANRIAQFCPSCLISRNTPFYVSSSNDLSARAKVGESDRFSRTTRDRGPLRVQGCRWNCGKLGRNTGLAQIHGISSKLFVNTWRKRRVTEFENSVDVDSGSSKGLRSVGRGGHTQAQIEARTSYPEGGDYLSVSILKHPRKSWVVVHARERETNEGLETTPFSSLRTRLFALYLHPFFLSYVLRHLL